MEPDPSQRYTTRGLEATGTQEILARFQDKISQWGGQSPGSCRCCAVSILGDILNSARQVCLTQWALLCVKGWAQPPEVLSKWSYSAVLWLQLKFHWTQLNRVLSGATIENPKTDLTQNLRDLNSKKNTANYFYCKLWSSIFINFWKFNFVSFLCFVDSIKIS